MRGKALLGERKRLQPLRWFGHTVFFNNASCALQAFDIKGVILAREFADVTRERLRWRGVCYTQRSDLMRQAAVRPQKILGENEFWR